MRLGLIAAAFGLLCVGQADTVQLFVGDEGCYGGGTELVIREAVEECLHGAGGWGDAVMECYSDGAMYYQCGVTVELTCCSADLDMDGDVDLHDFSLFQQAFTGE